MYSLLPSLPAQSFTELAELADALLGVADELQVDIVDGAFVPAISWPFTKTDPKIELTKLQSLIEHYRVEIDCMVMHPEQYLNLFVELGIPRVIVHVGSTDNLAAVFDHTVRHTYTLGLAFTNDVPLDGVIQHIDSGSVDFIQIMGIRRVGMQGQPFDERTLGTAHMLRERYPDLEIAVDGSVNAQTIPKLKAAGVNRFAPGSAIAKQKNPRAAFEQLRALIDTHRFENSSGDTTDYKLQ